MRSGAGSFITASPRGKPARRAAAVGLGGAALWCGPGLAVHWPPLARALGVPLGLEGSSGVALTFDDGPHPEGTPAVLKALRGRHAKATFFLVGEQVERYPSLAAEIVRDGHEVAVHGYRHRNQMRFGPRSFARDLDRALEVISGACGRVPGLYRPPYGVFTLAGLVAIRRRGLQPLLWSKWGRDWRAAWSPDRITTLATDGVAAGDVILLHDADWYSASGSHRNTAAALPAILDALDRRGLVSVTATPPTGVTP